jgi:hypothetical protein
MRYKLDIDTNIDNVLSDVDKPIDAKEIVYEVDPNVDNSKRDFLRGAAAVGGLTLAPGVMLYQTASAKPAEQAVSNQQC